MARNFKLLKSAGGRITRLTNNPERGSNNWTRLTPGRRRVVAQVPNNRGTIRRLMKRDLTNALGTPDSQLLARKNGEAGTTGGRSIRVLGRFESKRTKTAKRPSVMSTSTQGVRAVRDRGVNRGIKKR